MSKIKLDLHVHSEYSFDSINKASDFELAFKSGKIDQIAITDHDEIKGALKFADQFGPNRVIVGEEIRTTNGPDVIGLFIQKFVPKGLTLERTCELIKNQNGLVYIPHPKMRKYGVSEIRLRELINLKLVDIIEVFNGWEHFTALNPTGRISHNHEALLLAQEFSLSMASSTDAHTPDSLGLSHTLISKLATRENLLSQLRENTENDLIQVTNKLHPNDIKAIYKFFRKVRVQ